MQVWWSIFANFWRNVPTIIPQGFWGCQYLVSASLDRWHGCTSPQERGWLRLGLQVRPCFLLYLDLQDDIGLPRPAAAQAYRSDAYCSWLSSHFASVWICQAEILNNHSQTTHCILRICTLRPDKAARPLPQRLCIHQPNPAKFSVFYLLHSFFSVVRSI